MVELMDRVNESGAGSRISREWTVRKVLSSCFWATAGKMAYILVGSYQSVVVRTIE